MKYIPYVVGNLFFQIFTFWFFVLMNTYYNGLLIPDSLRWKDGALGTDVTGLTGLGMAQATILFIELILMTLAMYRANKQFLAKFLKAKEPTLIAARTAKIYAAISSLFILATTYLNFR